MNEPQPISIWQPHHDASGALYFERPAPGLLGDHYATRLRIPAKKPMETVRICFFGESAAVGYLYAPHLTPAMVLQHHLNTAVSHPRYEVVDLARTNERLDTLLSTVEASLQLQPDRLVIFAGNNWNLLETPHISPYAPGVNGRWTIADALRQNGMRGLADLGEAALIEKVKIAFVRLSKLVEQKHLPVTIVIPEVNLADWETRQPLPWLDNDKSIRWYALYEESVAAIENEGWQTLFETANAMLSLDGEQCPTSWRLLAIAQRGLGNTEKACLAAQLEVAATQYATLGFLAAPQMSVIEQELLRQISNYFGFQVVDLPSLLPQLSGSSLPGRTLFADYCHLTAQGMHLAMTAVAAAILEQSPTDLLAQLSLPPLAPAQQAVAEFGAAIHTAHRQLPVNPRNEMVRTWCQQALETDAGVIAAMVDVVEARCAALPVVLTAVQQRNLQSSYPLQHQHGWRYAHLDAVLLEAIFSVLEEYDPAVREQLLDALVAAHGVGAAPRDLLRDGYYLWEPLARFYPETMHYADVQTRAYFRAAWPETGFALVVDEGTAVEVHLTGRLPRYGSRSEPVALWVNEQPVTTFIWTEKWQKTAVTIPQNVLQRGLNALKIKWPPLPPFDGKRHLIETLERGETADLYPVFGELFDLRVQR